MRNDEAEELEKKTKMPIKPLQEQTFQDPDIDCGYIVNPMERIATELEIQETIDQVDYYKDYQNISISIAVSDLDNR